MRILHAYSSFHPRRGGVPVAVASLALAQREAGADARLCSLDRPGSLEVETFMQRGGFEDVPMMLLPAVRRGTRAVPTPSPAILRSLDDVDVLHIHGVWEPLGLILAAAARMRGIPYAVAPHGMLAPWSLAHRPQRKRLALKLGYGAMLRHALFIHFLNPPERDETPKWIPLPERSELLPNGVFGRVFKHLPEPGAFRRAHAILPNKRLVLFLGRVHLQKGLLLLAEAFAKLTRVIPNAHLILAGPDEGGRAPTTERLRALGVAEQTLWTGPLYGLAKWQALVDADVFCLPSFQEAFSVAITEALGVGLPCVISHEAHYPLVTELHVGAVVERRPEAVANALATLLSNDSELEAMGQRAAAHVRAHLTWKRVAERSLSLYDHV